MREDLFGGVDVAAWQGCFEDDVKLRASDNRRVQVVVSLAQSVYESVGREGTYVWYPVRELSPPQVMVSVDARPATWLVKAERRSVSNFIVTKCENECMGKMNGKNLEIQS